ncbi:MAG: ABC transporter ATP-binding protein, partial [Ostreibacterium sp.]
IWLFQMSSITLKNLKKDYNGATVLHDINAEINDGEFIVIIGESGCGKTTLLRMICGLEEISSGELLINDKIANNMVAQQRDMAMVFQSYALYPHMQVYDNIAYSLKIQKVNKKKIDEKVKEVAKQLGIEQCLDRFPKHLSGGQRQRVAMGRAIVRKPKFFLFDEPLSNLDAKLRVVMRSEIKKLHNKLGTTTIYVTHDQIEAMTMADRVILLDKGDIVQMGSPEDLYDRPNSIFSASFLGSPKMSLLNGQISFVAGEPVFYTNDGLKFAINKPKTQLNNDQKVILGIRPRDFYLSDKDNGFKVATNIYEYTGPENIIYGHIGENEVNITLTKQGNFDIKEDLYINYNMENIHLFDTKTEKIIH